MRDRWPLGLKVKVHTATRYELEFFHRNVLGTGLNLEYEIPVRTSRTPKVGHRFKASYTNIGGAFVDAEAQRALRQIEEAFLEHLKGPT